jgi:N-acetylglucosaminyldiphosphoundecaprenol N-acetyl-beta-D-mannosaminyltransferase
MESIMFNPVLPENARWDSRASLDRCEGSDPDRASKVPVEKTAIPSVRLFGVNLYQGTLSDAVALVSCWASAKNRTRLITFSTAHMISEGSLHESFRSIHASMDLNCMDGMPLVWMARLLTGTGSRCCGPDFMPEFCARTAKLGLRHFFLGGADGTAERVAIELKRRSPELRIAGWFTPPFRAMTKEEDAQCIDFINSSNADLVWVCLGCPKQERWLNEHRDRLNPTVVLAVGLAFDTVAGNMRRAPAPLRNMGLEWAYRLCTEPRRLAKRYFISNSIFLGAAVSTLLSAGAQRLFGSCVVEGNHPSDS